MTTHWTEDEFVELARTSGHDLQRWPEAYRPSAVSYINEHSFAQSVMRDAEALDRALDGYDVAPADDAFLTRLYAISDDVSHVRRSHVWHAASLIASLVLGLYFGFSAEEAYDIQANSYINALLFSAHNPSI